MAAITHPTPPYTFRESFYDRNLLLRLYRPKQARLFASLHWNEGFVA